MSHNKFLIPIEIFIGETKFDEAKKIILSHQFHVAIKKQIKYTHEK
jgi:hypothetical protein